MLLFLPVHLQPEMTITAEEEYLLLMMLIK